MNESEEKKTRPKLRYRGGTSRDAKRQNTNPDEVGFGDLKKADALESSQLQDLLNKIGIVFSTVSKLSGRIRSLVRVNPQSILNVLKKIDLTPIKNINIKQYANKITGSNFVKTLGPGTIVIIVILLFVVVPMLRSVSKETTENGEVSGAQLQTQSSQSLPDKYIEIEGAEKQIIEDRGIIQTSHETPLGTFVLTQQALPEEYKENIGSLKNLALAIPDRLSVDRFETDKGQVHVATTSTRTQVVIFSYNEVLVFINSERKLSNEDWLNYINVL